jgi:hypothetical protein
MIARGTFHPNIQPLKAYATGQEGITLSRMSIEKTFNGDLQAVSTGEMLAAMTPVTGSAGYVAIEQVSGVLGDLTGSFVLQHFGIMQAGEQRLILEIVPDSGTEQFLGISGRLTIEISGEDHFYTLDYELGRQSGA